MAWIPYDSVIILYDYEKTADGLTLFIARVLRLLATNHIFIESSPDVFKNNRVSSMLDTMKSLEDLKAKYGMLMLDTDHSTQM
jgi:hypothetical protein